MVGVIASVRYGTGWMATAQSTISRILAISGRRRSLSAVRRHSLSAVRAGASHRIGNCRRSWRAYLGPRANSAVVKMSKQIGLVTFARMTMMPAREASTSGPITIDRTSPVPLYFQLAQYFESGIRSGSLKVGARLANEVQLAERLGLSRPTVRAAFLYLANKGLVVRKRGAGTVVANERIDRNVELTSLYDDLAASGRTPSTRVLKAEVSHASDQVAEALQLPERGLVMSLERIRLADGEPMALMHNYLPAGLVQLNVEMLQEHGLYELLRASGIGLYSATQRMGAKNASATEARTLDETRGTALLTMERIVYDQAGRPVEFARHLYRASRYAFTTSFPRPETVIG
jgi:DNA-binding GntR family transcriptional regulator